MHEPHAVSFMVCEEYHIQDGNDTVRVIMVDMRSKTIRSVFRYPEGRQYAGHHLLLPSRISGYLNCKPSSGKLGPLQAKTVPDLASENHTEIKLETNTTITDIGRPASKSSNAPMKTSSLELILAAVKEIPSLDRDDMLKAYHILQNSYGSPN
ncbi:hypothetical protein BAE44_0004256 [Dichanthelium oligosanthes]|uniref:Uncharacterized protein n=1 Tax=Dichanthelium oligosanthes TaxID=888268 RepID=A0A1E5WBG2_9POAL|nr:hypothetical protein BAE44_0004256 [Dichanthelium oligosanthes]